VRRGDELRLIDHRQEGTAGQDPGGPAVEVLELELEGHDRGQHRFAAALSLEEHREGPDD